MSQNERLNNIENRTNIIFNEINKIQTNYNNLNTEFNNIRKEFLLFTNLTTKIDKFIDSFENKTAIKINPYADENGNLNNPKNPFIKESIKYSTKEYVSESINSINLNTANLSNKIKSDSSDKSKKEHKRGKYKKREPLYFYFDIDNKTYRYTCENKNSINKLKFKCSDTKCKAEAEYSKIEDKFIPNLEEDKKHIPFEEHSYVIPTDIKEKVENKTLNEKDFLINGKLDNKKIGAYFKYKFLNNFQLKTIDAKIEFAKNFPNIKLSEKSINTYILTKYREASNVNDEKIKNTNNIFIMKDDNNEKISETYNYYSPEDIEKKNELKFVIIGAKEMIKNLSNNLIDQFYMDCTYSTVPPSIFKFKLMAISGHDCHNNTTVLCVFILLMNEKKYTFDEIFKTLKNIHI